MRTLELGKIFCKVEPWDNLTVHLENGFLFLTIRNKPGFDDKVDMCTVVLESKRLACLREMLEKICICEGCNDLFIPDDHSCECEQEEEEPIPEEYPEAERKDPPEPKPSCSGFVPADSMSQDELLKKLGTYNARVMELEQQNKQLDELYKKVANERNELIKAKGDLEILCNEMHQEICFLKDMLKKIPSPSIFPNPSFGIQKRSEISP